MTKHELASSAWGSMHEHLALIAVLNGEFPDDLRDDLVAVIERGMDEILKPAALPRAFEHKDEARLALTDNAKININSPVGERITVDASAFTLSDGHVVVQAGEEIVIREKHGQVLITKRRP
jgi:hypothetical protein